MSFFFLTLKYDPDQPRDEKGQWSETGATSSAPEDTGFSPPAAGQSVVVYRLGKNPKLENDNAGNAQGVAYHLAILDGGRGGGGEHVMAFEVKVDKYGRYTRFSGGDPTRTGDTDSVGREATLYDEENARIWYSFPKGGPFTYRHLATVPLLEIRNKLKDLHGTTDFETSGSIQGADAIRAVMESKFRH